MPTERMESLRILDRALWWPMPLALQAHSSLPAGSGGGVNLRSTDGLAARESDGPCEPTDTLASPLRHGGW